LPSAIRAEGATQETLMLMAMYQRVVIGLLCLCSAVPLAQAQLRTLQVNVFREDAAMAIGRVKGFFAAEGLEVKVVRTANSTDQMRGLSNGTFQVVSTAFDNVLGWSGREGAELIAVAQIIDTAVYPVFVRPEIKQWNDLRGKKLAVDAVDTAFALVLRRVLLDKGLDFTKGDYELIAVGNTPLRLESMKKGDTFAGVLTPPVDGQAAAAGMVRLGDSSQVLPGFPNTLFATSRGWAQKERAQLVGYLRAWLAALRWMRANPAEAQAILETEFKVNAKVAAGFMQEMTTTGAINPAGLEQALQLRNGFGMTPLMGPAISRYYDSQYHEAAAKR
jgi:ABC-type nitrate/sulfonate/bicarbonate transport system substrate-binding protein